MANGRCRMHGGPSPGAPKGNRNAWKHGRFTAEAIARRREGPISYEQCASYWKTICDAWSFTGFPAVRLRGRPSDLPK
jgi:hypothetical protein